MPHLLQRPDPLGDGIMHPDTLPYVQCQKAMSEMAQAATVMPAMNRAMILSSLVM